LPNKPAAAVQLTIVRVYSDGDKTSGVKQNYKFNALISQIQEILAEDENPEDIETENDPFPYPGYEWKSNDAKVYAKVMIASGKCSSYELKRDSVEFTVDIVIILPFEKQDVDARNPKVLVNYIIQLLGVDLVKAHDDRGSYKSWERLADNKLGETLHRQSAITKIRSYIETPPFRSEGISYGIAATWGSPGAGKSHLLDEIARIKVDGQYVPLSISFNGKTMGVVYGVRGLLIRMILTYFVGIPSIQQNTWNFSNVASILDQNLPSSLKIENVLSAIRYDFSQIQTCDAENIKILLLVDEIAKPPHTPENVAEIYRDIVKTLTTDKIGIVFTALDGTQILPGRNEGATSSSRPLYWLDLPALPTVSWENQLESEGDYISARLYSMTGGHPRTIQFLKKALSRHLTLGIKLDSTTTTTIMRDVAMNLQCNSEEVFYWLLPAILGRKLQLKNRDDTPTEFSLAIAKGFLINTPSGFLDAIPKISLFMLSVASEELMSSDRYHRHAKLLSLIVTLLSSPLDGFRFEEFHAYREALYLLLLFEEKREESISIVNDLYKGSKLTSGREVFVTNKNYFGAISVQEQLLTIEPFWTIAHVAGCSRINNRKFHQFEPGTIVFSQNKTSVGFDVAVFHEEASNPPKPHPLLLECKFTSSKLLAMFNDMKSKLDLVIDRFRSLFQNKNHPFIRSGIESFHQITYMFVSNHGISTSSLIGNASEYFETEENERELNGMSVAIISVEELIKQYGPTISSACGFLGYSDLL
ncbi:hypothetical protein HK096_003913, partial [Nowakowskiella sp. JEL0078]